MLSYSTTYSKTVRKGINLGYTYMFERNVLFNQIPENLLIALALETNLTNIIECDKRKYHFTAWVHLPEDARKVIATSFRDFKDFT